MQFATREGIITKPFVERLIGTIRREYLDYIFFWNTFDLEKKPTKFGDYYNGERVHSSLDGHAPEETAGRPCREPSELGDFQGQPHCRDLYQLPAAA